MIAWKLMDSAPKDGKQLLLFEEGDFYIGSWRVDEGYSGDKEPDWYDNSYDDFSTGYSSTPLSPEFWSEMNDPIGYWRKNNEH
tara:strand:+ start:694 stop:942 length:249 start_codon:yes stop_codon:yes gene_type:complete